MQLLLLPDIASAPRPFGSWFSPRAQPSALAACVGHSVVVVDGASAHPDGANDLAVTVSQAECRRGT